MVQKLNPGIKFEWILADNASPMGQNVSANLEKFKVVPGLKRDDSYPSWARGSYHHSSALNGILPHIKTRFALSLDNDFFIIRKNWIRDIVGYMEKNGIAIAGSPWYPKDFKKIRYFPAHHCLFIDLEKIKQQTLDFRPDYDFSPKSKFSRINKKVCHFLFGERWLVGSSKDTGFKIFKKYREVPGIRSECFAPFFDYKPGILSGFLPDAFSLIPQKNGYISERKFSDCGYFDANREGWEEFFWQGKPFGFHMKGVYKTDSSELKSKFEALETALRNLA